MELVFIIHLKNKNIRSNWQLGTSKMQDIYIWNKDYFENETAIWLHVYQKGAPNVFRGYKYPITYVAHQLYPNVWLKIINNWWFIILPVLGIFGQVNHLVYSRKNQP